MIIKLTAINDTKLGKSPAKEVVGTKIQDGSAWKKAFFANQKDLRDALEDFEVGDIVNVVMEQKGDYWNISDFKEASDDDIEKATTGGKKFGKGVDAGGFPSRRADGSSRGDDTNRASAIYLAREIVKMAMDSQDHSLYVSPRELSLQCINLANDFICPYIKDGAVPVNTGGIPVQETSKRSKKGSADPLTPPTVED
jgi:hypothetical protein